jgi:hypothetical protein
MCIIVIKPAGIPMPSTATLRECWASNPDGAGIMYPCNAMGDRPTSEWDRVRIDKGYMHVKPFLARLDALTAEIDVLNTPMIFHFRISTSGGHTPENTHPFPVADNLDALHALKADCDIGVVHNGMIPIARRARNVSDTVEYILAQLCLINRIRPDFYRDQNAIDLIANQTHSKFAFLTAAGEFATIGTFYADGGLLFSNQSYMPLQDWRSWRTSWTAYDEARCGGTNADYEEVGLVWLDSELEYVTLPDGEMAQADDFLIDSHNNVYLYDGSDDSATPVDGARVIRFGDKGTEFTPYDACLLALSD